MCSLPQLVLAAGLAHPGAPAAVSGANVATECQWPTVVSYRAGDSKCSGLLVHPRVIVTAAHCIEDAPAGGVRFGEQFQPAERIVDALRCGIDPVYASTGAPSSDVGYCVLEEAVQDIPLTPVLMGCETDWLRAGLPAVIVGLGATPDDPAFGTKRYAFTVLDSDLRSDGTVWVGDADVNGCLGDSGGPTFVRSPAGTWHALGVLAHGPECGQGPVLYRALFDRIGWLEQETGYDLSPCHDAEGAWDPGSACGTIAADPLTAGSVWSQACAGATIDAPNCPEPAPPDPTDGITEPLDGSGEDPSGLDDAAPTGCGCATAPRPTTSWTLTLLVLLLSRRRRRSARAPRTGSAPRPATS
ncbi:MAG: trypsin-like serine protease [Nannocystaceae bacterium]